MKEIVIYGHDHCPGCKSAKAHLKAKGIPYTEKDVTKDAEAMAELQRFGASSVPLIVVDGEPLFGYQKAKLDALLK